MARNKVLDTSATHTKEWWEGYTCLFPRSRNPYQGNPQLVEKSADWLAGWLCRFFGEEP